MPTSIGLATATALGPAPWSARRAGTVVIAPRPAAGSLLGDGPWRRRDVALLGALLGGTAGALTGAAVHFVRDDDECAGGMGTACVITPPTHMLTSMLIGGALGAGVGAAIGVVVCERRSAGCYE